MDVDEAQTRVSAARKWTIRLVAALLVFLVASAAIFLVARLGLGLGNRMLEARYPPPGQMIAVGSHKLHLFCLGEGRPTVVIETGLGVDWAGWSRVIMPATKITRICVYDRAGYGWSEPGPFPRTAGQSADELYALLANSESFPGPYVLVAHSFGTHIVRLFASKHADLVSGVLFLDPYEGRAPHAAGAEPEAGQDVSRPIPGQLQRTRFERLLRAVPPLGWRRFKSLYRGEEGLPADIRQLPPAFRDRAIIASSMPQLAAERSERESRLTSQLQVGESPFPAEMPLIVVTVPETTPAQVRLVELSQRSRHVLAADASHLIQRDRPDLVIELIGSLVTSARDVAAARRVQ